MRIFKFFFFAISGFIGLYILACTFMPSNFEVSRDIEINANPLIVFNLFLLKQNICHRIIRTTNDARLLSHFRLYRSNTRHHARDQSKSNSKTKSHKLANPRRTPIPPRHHSHAP